MAFSNFSDSANWACNRAGQARHFFLEGITIALDLLSPNITTGREDMAVCGNLSGGRGLAESR